MIAPVIIMAPQGVRLANHLSQEGLRKVFSIFFFIVALEMMRTLYL